MYEEEINTNIIDKQEVKETIDIPQNIKEEPIQDKSVSCI